MTYFGEIYLAEDLSLYGWSGRLFRKTPDDHTSARSCISFSQTSRSKSRAAGGGAYCSAYNLLLNFY